MLESRKRQENNKKWQENDKKWLNKWQTNDLTNDKKMTKTWQNMTPQNRNDKKMQKPNDKKMTQKKWQK